MKHTCTTALTCFKKGASMASTSGRTKKTKVSADGKQLRERDPAVREMTIRVSTSIGFLTAAALAPMHVMRPVDRTLMICARAASVVLSPGTTEFVVISPCKKPRVYNGDM